ncbi:hypothetical protein [Sorangium sp. So ce131]|uniref:hypothetical protein n=1 Tax=Sorangium sp. So ce131 TaxID=3133282 RepID=UPI003F60165A
MKATQIISLAVMATGITVAASTHADNQFVAGMNCRNQTDTIGSYEVSSSGYALSGGRFPVALVCPIDRTAFGSAGSMAVRVFVHDKNPTPDEDVCCFAAHRNAGGPSVVTSGTSCTSSTGEYQSFDITIPSYVGTWDYAYVHCSLPPAYNTNRSAIIAYRGVEQ